MNKMIAVALCGLCAWPLMAQKRYQLQSPDQQVQVEVTMDEQIRFALSLSGEEVMNSTLSLTLADGKVLGANPKVTKTKRQSVNQTIPSPFYKKSEVEDQYNELSLDLKGN